MLNVGLNYSSLFNIIELAESYQLLVNMADTVYYVFPFNFPSSYLLALYYSFVTLSLLYTCGLLSTFYLLLVSLM